MMDDLTAAMNTDGERFAAFFTEDGVFEEVNLGQVTVGREDIARVVNGYLDMGFWTERIGPVIQSGTYVATAAEGASSDSVIVIYELTPDGQVHHMWGIAD